MISPYSILARKRSGEALDESEIRAVVAAAASGEWSDAQLGAFLMAVAIRGLDVAETRALTKAMLESGEEWKLADEFPTLADKHSTGGVGDKVSLVLSPILAACGQPVVMLTGRGLGHTGGTLDKAESIPGYQATPDFELFRKVVKSVGCAIIGQTADLAPADRRFYAIRDVTATVESVPLITASILSKKIAAGLEGLVMDVKVGSGAFMTSLERAEKLARSIIGTAATAGLKTHALVTDMNEVLGLTAGNALEIAESVEFLKNENRDPRLNEVVSALCAEMLIVTGIEQEPGAARAKVEVSITSGSAVEKFSQMVAELGGPTDFVEKYTDYLPRAAIEKPVRAAESGILAEVDAHAIGSAIIELGSGRQQLGDKLDLSVGISDVATIGEIVGTDRPLAIVHASSEADADLAASLIRDACTISADKPAERPVIVETLTAE